MAQFPGAWRSSVVALSLLLGACGLAATAAGSPAPDASAPARAGEVDLIPRSVLFANPDRAAPRLSPDGKFLSYLAPLNGVLNVWVGPADNPGAAKPVTRDDKRGIRQYFWAYDSTHVVYLQDSGGDENWRVYAVNATTGEQRDLTPMQGVAAQVQQVSEKFPGEILVALNDRNPMFHDVHRVNLATGERTLVQQNDGFAGFLTDDDFRVRFASRMTPDGGSELLKADGEGGFESWQKIGMEDSLTTSPVGFDATGGVLYMLDSRGRDTGALFAVDLSSGKRSLLAESEKADAGTLVVHPVTKKVQAVEFNHKRPEWEVLDPALLPHLRALGEVNPGAINIVSRTLDDARWIVAFLQDAGPTRFYTYDTASRRADFLFTNRASLEGLPLASMHPVIIPARDGLELVSYLTLPPGREALAKSILGEGAAGASARNGGARASGPVPMVLLVHGGPWARDDWGFDPYHQWLANRGYAVLSVNFRGSTGFGKAFLNAGNREWAGKMHDDLIDAVNWAVEKGVADKDRVAIMGGSYGGYATLVGLTFTPETFAAGVSIVGPSNIVTLLNTIPPYWAPAMELFRQRVGDHTTEEGRAFLEARSPLTFVERIQRPLLIGQGANDPRVKQSESDQIVDAMLRKGIPVSYVLFPDEGHGFARPENNKAFNGVTEAFLSRHLGGRFEPLGDDLSKSTAEVRVGAEFVPGLTGGVKPEKPGR